MTKLAGSKSTMNISEKIYFPALAEGLLCQHTGLMPLKERYDSVVYIAQDRVSAQHTQGTT